VVLAPAIINVLACLTFGVLDNFGMTRLHDCDTGVGSAKIDSNNTKKLENVTRTYVEKLCCEAESSERAKVVVVFL
jgi:hypothetical protein